MNGICDFIINPKARSGMGEMVWRRLEPELKKRRVPYRAHLTGSRRHAEHIAEAITADGMEHTLVVLGGDGTLNEVVNGIKEPEKAILGYIPAGSGNDFSRGLAIPSEPLCALERILRREGMRRIDIGVLERAGSERRFVVSAGAGFDAAVCHEICVSRWKTMLNKIGLGKLSYTAVALDRLKKDRPVRLELEFPDGSREVCGRTYFAAFLNLPYEGGGFRFAPEALPDDGMLDVLVLHDVPLWKILFLLPLAFGGKHVHFKGVTLHRCTGVRMGADRALPLHTDGEPGFLRRDIRVRCEKEKLRVLGCGKIFNVL
ncbi:MAG TPA: diacylglycerol kinase family lipid kinase [Candidatus Mediterraneibacter merdipullorum]|nr:diacylglycerol kinase family lipid kinase [Candidatus Mediterraneibacter merdipullorum]